MPIDFVAEESLDFQPEQAEPVSAPAAPPAAAPQSKPVLSPVMMAPEPAAAPFQNEGLGLSTRLWAQAATAPVREVQTPPKRTINESIALALQKLVPDPADEVMKERVALGAADMTPEQISLSFPAQTAPKLGAKPFGQKEVPKLEASTLTEAGVPQFIAGPVAGTEQVAAGLVDFSTSAPGVLTLMAGAVTGGAGAVPTLLKQGTLGKRAIASAFTYEMGKNAPDELANMVQGLATGDAEAVTKAIANGAMTIAVTRHAVSPHWKLLKELDNVAPLTAKETAKAIEIAPEPTKTEVVEKGPSNAIPERSPTAVPVEVPPETRPEMGGQVRDSEAPAKAQAGINEPRTAQAPGQASETPGAGPGVAEAPAEPAKPTAPFAMYMSTAVEKPVALFEVPGAREGWKNHVSAEKAREMGFEPEPAPTLEEWKKSKTEGGELAREEKVQGQGQEVAQGSVGAAEPGGSAAPVQKQPWEMTKEEFRRHLITTEGFQAQPRDIKEAQSQSLIHRDYIQQALREGKPVPPEVLADYPDLKPKTAAPVQEPQGGVPYYKKLGEQDAIDPSRKRMRSVPQNFKLAYRNGWYEAKKAADSKAKEASPSSPQSLGIVPPGMARVAELIKDAPGWIARNFTKERGLPEEAYKAHLKQLGTVNENAVQTLYAVRDLEAGLRKLTGKRFGPLGKTADPALVQQMNEALAGGPINSLPGPLRAPIQAMRDHIDSLSAQMIRDGLVDSRLQAVLGDNLGVYLNRSYRVFEDPKWVYDQIPIDIRNKARNLIKYEMGLTEAEAESYVRDMFNDWKESGALQVFKGRRLGAKDLSLFRKRKTIDPEIRALMGEYKDPFINYQRTIAKQSRLIADQQFLDDIRRIGLGNWLFEEGKNPVGFNHQIAAEGSQVMSPLNGLRTTENLARVFNEWGRVAPDYGAAFRLYMGLNSLTKMAKTVYSPMTHARNMLSQPFFWLMNGHYNLGALKEAIGTTLSDIGAMNDVAWRDYHKRLARLNLVNEGVFTGELRDSIRDFSKRFNDQEIDPMGYGIGAFLKTIAVKAPQKAYRLADEFGKVVGFESELARIKRDNPGIAIQEAELKAAERVRNTYPTYSNVPEAFQNFRRVPLIGPFMSFAYESLRTAGHSLRYAVEDYQNGHTRSATERATGALLALGGLTFGLQALSRHIVGLTQEDDRDMRRQLPPWEKNSAFLYTDRDNKGISRINLSYNNPYSYMVDPIIAAANGDEKTFEERMVGAAAEFLRPWTSEQILAGAIADIGRNQTADGRRIFNPQDTPQKQWESKLAHLFEAVEPGGLTRLRKRIIPAAQKRQDARATLTQELVAEATGYRVVRHDFLKQLDFTAHRFVENGRDATRLFSEGLGSLKPTDNILEKYKSEEDARFRLWKELHRDIQATSRQGISKANIFRTLRASGVGEADARALLVGKYRPYFPTQEVRTRAKKVGKVLPIQEIRQEYLKRSKLVLD